jgi:hypothetical protein
VEIALATEDELSEAVGGRLIAELGEGFSTSIPFRGGGNGYLKIRMEKFVNYARHYPLLLITDLDSVDCAGALVTQWLGKVICPRKLLFRVAVREVEAWLLADHEGMKSLFGGEVYGFPEDPDALPDPKHHLLRLAQGARRDVRSAILPARNSGARIGLGYNAVLSAFVRANWSPARAARRSDSLRRTRVRLRGLTSVIEK